MDYLVDGHNLIARTPGLSLADPDDEAKLVAILKRWAMADRRRKVTVIFDSGLPAGESRKLSGGGVKVVFASNNSNADAVLIRRIEAIGNPPEHTVVTSDGAIAAAAARRRVPVQTSEAFAAAMLADRRFGSPEKEGSERPEAPAMGSEELQEWLELFGPEPDLSPPEKKVQDPAPSVTRPSKKRKQAEIDDVDEWLRLFGYKE
jgi:hypothetical protein